MTLETKNDDNRTVLRVVINFDLGLINKFIKRILYRNSIHTSRLEKYP